MPGKPAIHFDLVVGKKAESKEFYKAIFDWNFETDDHYPDYEWINLTGFTGGMGLPKEAPPKLILYVLVENVGTTLSAVKENLPTSQVHGPYDNHPLGGHCGYFTDPNGIWIGVLSLT